MNKEKSTPASDDLRDKQGGTYDVDPGIATDADDAREQQLPEGLTRERMGPLNPRTGRHPAK